MVFNNFQVRISVTTVFNHLKLLHYIRAVPLRRNLENNVELEELISQNKIIFLDEVGFNVSMRVKKGRAVQGETPTTIVLNIRSKNISVCCVMSRLQILIKKYLIQHLTKFCFLTELHQKLDDLNLNGCCFIMDNVAFHKCTTIKEFIIASGHTVQYLKPYSPALNPI